MDRKLNKELAQSTLLIGYGNPDRQDDGIALHILTCLAQDLGRTLTEPIEDCFYPTGLNPDLWFDLQLYPEMAETISRYDRVCFIDAHTGTVPEEIQFTPISGYYQPSTLTHHMTPSTCLSLCQAVAGKIPAAVLISVRGYRFGFSREISPQTEPLIGQAVPLIKTWLSKIS